MGKLLRRIVHLKAALFLFLVGNGIERIPVEGEKKGEKNIVTQV
jgi:hypothetical protein